MCNSTPEQSDSTRRDTSNSTCQVHRSSQRAAAIVCRRYQKGVLLLCLSSCLATAALPAPLSSAYIHRQPPHARHPIPHVAHPAVIVAGVTPAQSSLWIHYFSQAVVTESCFCLSLLASLPCHFLPTARVLLVAILYAVHQNTLSSRRQEACGTPMSCGTTLGQPPPARSKTSTISVTRRPAPPLEATLPSRDRRCFACVPEAPPSRQRGPRHLQSQCLLYVIPSYHIQILTRLSTPLVAN